jgi:hypothetical protein
MASRLLSISPIRRWLEQNFQLWLRLMIIAVLLLASAYLGRQASARYLILLLGAGMALVFLRWPPLGLATLIVASLIVPFAIGTGTQTSLNVTVLLLPVLIGLWGFDMVAHQRRIWLLPSRTVLPLLALCVVAVLAFVAGNLPWLVFAQTAPLRAQAGGLAVFLLSAGAFLLVAHQVQDLRWLEWLTWLFVALGTLYIAGRLVPGLGRFTGRLFPDGATGSVFWVWLVALTFGQATFNRRLHWGWRLALGGLVLATFYIGLFPGRSWASGWLPPLVAVVAILWAGAPHLGRLATLAGGMAVLLNVQKVIGLLMVNEQYSVVTRWEAWRILAEIVKANPVLGLGPANYYYYTPLFPILGWYVNFNSHNQYVDIAAQTGLLGLACFLWFAWEVGRLGWRLRGRVSDGFAQAYVYGALGGLAGTLAAGMLADWLLPFVYNIGLAGFRASALGWIFLGGLVSLEQIVRQGNRYGS